MTETRVETMVTVSEPTIIKFPEKQFHMIINSDVRAGLARLPDDSVDLCVTSPPYWGLRDYGIELDVWDGKEGCEHEWGAVQPQIHAGQVNQSKFVNKPSSEGAGNSHTGTFCSICGAWCGQLGLEPTFQLYIQHIVQVMHEVKRVIKPTGSLYVNLGDTYATHTAKTQNQPINPREGSNSIFKEIRPPQSVPEKCLIGIPERIYIAMLDDGWIGRSKIIWHKPNHMPSSVKDRYSSSWEAVYFFVKQQRYFFDLDSVRVPLVFNSHAAGNKERRLPPSHLSTGHRGTWIPWNPEPKRSDPKEILQGEHSINKNGHSGYYDKEGNLLVNPAGKNPGDVIEAGSETRRLGAITGERGAVKVPGGKGWVGHPPGGGAKIVRDNDQRWIPEEGKNPGDYWEITTQPFPESHFAVFPEKLVKRTILASCPQEVCMACGKARERLVRRSSPPIDMRHTKASANSVPEGHPVKAFYYKTAANGQIWAAWKKENPDETIGWSTCSCTPQEYHPGIVLDPFAGSGTVAKVAKGLGRSSISIEIKPEYCEIMKKRIGFGEPTVDDGIEWVSIK